MSKKQDKIDLIVKELNVDIPIMFDPYKNATDCMILWERFSMGKWASINSYAVTNEWVAKVVNRRSQKDFDISAEGSSMIEAMTECMYRFFRDECHYDNENYRKVEGVL